MGSGLTPTLFSPSSSLHSAILSQFMFRSPAPQSSPRHCGRTGCHGCPIATLAGPACPQSTHTASVQVMLSEKGSCFTVVSSGPQIPEGGKGLASARTSSRTERVCEANAPGGGAAELCAVRLGQSSWRDCPKEGWEREFLL